MFLCFYFPSVFAQILHLCTAEYLLLLHPEVFEAVNLAVLRVYPQGSGSTQYSECFFSGNLHSVGTARLPVYLLKFKTHMRTFCLSTSITIMIMKMKVVPEHILTSFTLLLWQKMMYSSLSGQLTTAQVMFRPDPTSTCLTRLPSRVV